MRLAFPLGLLGLLFIIGLILIYILKPKYQEKKFASTHIWKLSLKYVKRKVPLQWLRSSLLFLIQLLIFVLAAFMLARPFFVLPTTKGEKIVILDGSASMSAQVGDMSRFDRAKSEIASLADSTVPDDRFTVILAGDEASYLVRRTDSLGFVRQKLSETACTLATTDFSAAMELAETVLEENPQAEVHLYTDVDYNDSGRALLHNMSSTEWNAAILNVTASRLNGKYVFTAEIASFGRSAELAVALTVDGKAQVPKLVTCEADGTVLAAWDSLNITSYESAEVRLQGANDAFPYDNVFSLCNSGAERFQVQLVSEDPGFLQRALSAVKTCDIVVPDENTPAKTSGFDLYIYDCVLPEKRPTDGAVWLIGPPYADGSGEMLRSEWGISFVGSHHSERADGGFTLTSAGGTGEAYDTIMHNVFLGDVFVSEYSEAGEYDGYESMILCNGSPVLLAKNENGLKTVVLAFDIHMSDITIRYSFPLLVSNICRYTMLPTVDGTLYNVGDTVRINAKPDTENMTVHAVYTDGTEREEARTSFPVDFYTEMPGSYTVTQTLASGRVVTDTFYVRIPQEESAFGRVEESLVDPVVFGDTGTDTDVGNDTMDIFVYLAAAMIVIVCIEWGLQYREQY